MGYTIDERRALDLLERTLKDNGTALELREDIAKLLADTQEQEQEFRAWAKLLDKGDVKSARKALQHYQEKWGFSSPNVSYMDSMTSFEEREIV